jgi:hypothetical protein
MAKGQLMDEQQSQKRGVRSEAQKTHRARSGHDPIPPNKPVAGAFGDHEAETASDQDVALRLDEKRRERAKQEGEA